MKFNELHRMVQRNGWMVIRQSGSHVIYEKNGKRYPVPDHGSKELSKPLELRIKKEMGLK
jgi:mRNA interferase HicA